MGRSKKPKPSFDVARDAVGGSSDTWVYRSDAPSVTTASAAARVAPQPGPPARLPSPPARSRPGWIETGVGIMVMPLTLTMMAMMAPVLWIAGSRPRR